MKIKTDNLSGLFSSKKEPSPSKENLYSVKNVDGESMLFYDPREISFHLCEDKKIYQRFVFQFVENIDWKIADSLKDAISGRIKGEKLITAREADCILRSQTSSDPQYSFDLNYLDSLLSCPEFSVFISEPSTAIDIGDTEYTRQLNIYSIRSRYNKGLMWKKTKREFSDDAARKRGDEEIDKIKSSLVNVGCGLWDSEIENGIPIELTKPEFYTWEQYRIKFGV